MPYDKLHGACVLSFVNEMRKLEGWENADSVYLPITNELLVQSNDPELCAIIKTSDLYIMADNKELPLLAVVSAANAFRFKGWMSIEAQPQFVCDLILQELRKRAGWESAFYIMPNYVSEDGWAGEMVATFVNGEVPQTINVPYEVLVGLGTPHNAYPPSGVISSYVSEMIGYGVNDHVTLSDVTSFLGPSAVIRRACDEITGILESKYGWVNVKCDPFGHHMHDWGELHRSARFTSWEEQAGIYKESIVPYSLILSPFLKGQAIAAYYADANVSESPEYDKDLIDGWVGQIAKALAEDYGWIDVKTSFRGYVTDNDKETVVCFSSEHPKRRCELTCSEILDSIRMTAEPEEDVIKWIARVVSEDAEAKVKSNRVVDLDDPREIQKMILEGRCDRILRDLRSNKYRWSGELSEWGYCSPDCHANVFRDVSSGSEYAAYRDPMKYVWFMRFNDKGNDPSFVYVHFEAIRRFADTGTLPRLASLINAAGRGTVITGTIQDPKVVEGAAELEKMLRSMRGWENARVEDDGQDAHVSIYIYRRMVCRVSYNELKQAYPDNIPFIARTTAMHRDNEPDHNAAEAVKCLIEHWDGWGNAIVQRLEKTEGESNGVVYRFMMHKRDEFPVTMETESIMGPDACGSTIAAMVVAKRELNIVRAAKKIQRYKQDVGKENAEAIPEPATGERPDWQNLVLSVIEDKLRSAGDDNPVKYDYPIDWLTFSFSSDEAGQSLEVRSLNRGPANLRGNPNSTVHRTINVPSDEDWWPASFMVSYKEFCAAQDDQDNGLVRMITGKMGKALYESCVGYEIAASDLMDTPVMPIIRSYPGYENACYVFKPHHQFCNTAAWLIFKGEDHEKYPDAFMLIFKCDLEYAIRYLGAGKFDEWVKHQIELKGLGKFPDTVALKVESDKPSLGADCVLGRDLLYVRGRTVLSGLHGIPEDAQPGIEATGRPEPDSEPPA